jgi:aryl-alcohol dehydrogenase-like predicted oxidoreductase
LGSFSHGSDSGFALHGAFQVERDALNNVSREGSSTALRQCTFLTFGGQVQYTLLGNTGLTVSRLGFGAMTFTAGNRDIASIYKVGAELADELVGLALDAGITFFDTADAYANGESESLLGAALKKKRDQVAIATKVGFRTGTPLIHSGLSRRHILWSVDRSLRRLGTDWIDIYIAHREDPFTPLEETLEALDAVVRQGKVRYLGFSNWSAWKVAAALEIQKSNGLAPFTHGQMYYSLLGRDVERDVIPMMRRYGLGLTVWSPLASGFLSGKYTRENLSDPNNRYSGFDILPFDKEHGFQLVELMRRIADEHQTSVAQIAIAWLLARNVVASVMLGATKQHQLADNLKAVEVRLSDAETAELDAATALTPVYPNWFIGNLIDQPMMEALDSSGPWHQTAT